MVLLRSKMGFSLVELLVVIAIIGILLALLLPAVQAAREAGRRCQCANNIRQIALAAQQYATTHRVFPAGCVIDASYRSAPWYDVWNEATKGNQGTSWMLMVLPYLEQSALYDQWDFHKNVKENHALASTNIAMFYCPSRRNGIRSADRDLMFEKWEGGGTDYGGCMTRGNGFFQSSSVGRSRTMRPLPDETSICVWQRRHLCGNFGAQCIHIPRERSRRLEQYPFGG